MIRVGSIMGSENTTGWVPCGIELYVGKVDWEMGFGK
jgi:hypothetical protein